MNISERKKSQVETTKTNFKIKSNILEQVLYISGNILRGRGWRGEGAEQI